MMMKKLAILFSIFCASTVNAQLLESFVHKGEFGGSIGLGHYFGDINNSASISKPKFSAGVFYRKQFNNYVGLKIAGNYSFLGYSDKESSNPVQRLRNLSFNTDVWELSISGDFNFFKFYPGFKEYRYTPYVSLGIGVINYDPYAYLAGEKYFLRPLGTEGQGSAAYPNLKPYSALAVVLPLGFGIKYNINHKYNAFAEICYRFTTTDYLDDVSGLYAGTDAFPLDPNTGFPTAAFYLQDRSYEFGNSIGIKGRQRGNSKQKDAFATFQVGISINIQSYRCPTY
jgi:Domain of unknown function (DUF6089)